MSAADSFDTPAVMKPNGQGALVLRELAEARELNDQLLRRLSVFVDRTALARLAGQTFDGRRDLYWIFGYDRLVTLTQYRDEYARGGIAKRIVEAYPKATWRGGVGIYEDEDPNVETPFEQAFGTLEQKFNIWSVLQSADILAGLSTYSVILIGDGADLTTELKMGSGKPDNLLYFQPFFGGGGPGSQSRRASAGPVTDDSDVSIYAFETDPASDRFGEARSYMIRRTNFANPMNFTDVHWSRIIHICEGALDNRVYGVPTLECVWNYLGDLMKVTGGAAESYFQRAKHTLNVNIQKDATFTEDDKTALKNKLDEYMHNMTDIIPTREVDVKLIEAAIARLGTEVDSILTLISGATGIPKRILTGSEMGELASTQDAANFDSQVNDRRTGYAGPMIVKKLVDRLIKYRYLPQPKQYEVDWPVKESMTEPEKATFAVSMANANKTFGAPIFTEDEIREKTFDMEPLPEAQPSEFLSEAEKADIAAKLAMTNKTMGVTVFTDDEIREFTYGLPPLSDDEKVPIGAPERISVTEPPPIGEDGQPIPQSTEGQPPPAKPVPGAKVQKPALKAARSLEAQLLRTLEEAIRVGDRETVDKLLHLQANKYATTQVQLPPSIATQLISYGLSIPDVDVDQVAGGREDDPHVTVKYGIEVPDPVPIANAQVQLNGRLTSLGKAGKLQFTLGRSMHFSGPDSDVVVLAVKGEDLAAVNRAIASKVACAPSSHPQYVPHATVAYVKSGTGQKYDGWDGLDGVTVTVDSITLADASGNRQYISLVDGVARSD